MKVTVVGSGYVGLVTTACLADAGNHVVGVDIDEKKVQALSQGRSPIYEPGLEEMLQANLAAGRLRFTTNLNEGVEHGHVLFIGVGTPPRSDGSADLSGVESICRDIADSMTSAKVIVIKSTVPVGTGRRMFELMMDRTAHPLALVSNPEFLKEGAALEDFLRPDRVIIGCDDPEAAQLMSELYAPFVRGPRTIMMMSREAAEMVKYASNAYLATRISFINEIADICAHTGVDINQVRMGMGADRRIGQDFLEPGVGYGGSCFPKDVQALIQVALHNDCDASILRSVHQRNDAQKEALATMVTERFGSDLAGKTFAVWGLAFKPNTDDIREAPAVRVVRCLVDAGAEVRAYDPKAGANARKELGDGRVTIVDDAYAALQDADALLICTEWNEFRTPDFDRIRSALRQRVIFDGRNLYQPATMIRQRIEYYSIGRPPARPARSKWATAESRFAC
ncbi:MAG: UDP-glucose 6-dehydrogenase YwqF [Planctomycetes bacterium ADurb.Bin126]|nr:MAG: UDP-glucose 6-dehydrogenase YwqF [Planctomycetes bacterium ADurb.Bin126]HOD80714.1 UDP-glucose/GDP-mannose dehydrogenase family protein [Phycisphaerae bacterium]HQL74914.1 UDP-glucose/GDP-mannose dehydrogenase family protein [Phycisphaerae bacterium]